MPRPPAFVPRELLEVPEFFGEQEEPRWQDAVSFEGALRLARAREQHELAYVIYCMRLKRDRSVPDVAAMLGLPAANLRRKLQGEVPAQEEDLIAWCWLTGEQRRNYQPERLLENGAAVEIPRFAVRHG